MIDPPLGHDPGVDQMGATLDRLRRTYLIGVPGMTEVWLVRHADAYQDGPSGPDPGLSGLGREQARRLSQRLGGLRIDAIYSSPMRRARETAKTLAPQIHSDPRLREARFKVGGGRLELTEPVAALVARMGAAVDDAVSGHPDGRVVLVSHGLAILHYLGEVLDLPPGGFHFFPELASINVVRGVGDRRRVGALGDVAHLEGMAD